MRFDLVTANVESFTGRIYPMAVVKQIAKHIRKGRNFVLLGAPQTSMLDIERVCARMEDPVIKNGVLSVEVQMVKTPMGAMAEALIAELGEEVSEYLSLRLSGSGYIKNKRVNDYNFHCAFFTTQALEEKSRPNAEPTQ